MSENEDGDLARPATIEDFKVLIKSLNDNDVEYLLIGGYALFVHGYHRATVDIDILVKGNFDTGVKVKKALLILPDGCAKDIEPSWFEEGENIRVADAFIVDVMINACGESYDSLKQHMITVDVDGIPVKTIDIVGLLKTKKTVREKDSADSLVLQRALDALNLE